MSSNIVSPSETDDKKQTVLLPDRTLGVLGGGQLGRMMAWGAHRLGVRLIALDKGGKRSPAGEAAHDAITGGFTDARKIRELAGRCDVLTVEIEHIDTKTLEELAEEGKEVQPEPRTLKLIQDKYVQKVHLQKHDIPLPEFRAIETVDDIKELGKEWEYPLMIKSRLNAYDGKGNAVAKNEEDIAAAVKKLGGIKKNALYVERWAPFVAELAVMVARGKDDEIVAHPVVETVQKDNVCHTVYAPARASPKVLASASAIARKAISVLPGRGIFGVELFQLKDGTVLLNEIAPRPHNSGHYTLEACVTDQFEQHLRAVLGLPLGDPSMKVGAAVMINTLGAKTGREGYEEAYEPHTRALKVKGTTPHWYGKIGCRPGRKMGHVTIVGSTMKEVLKRKAIFEGEDQIELDGLSDRCPLTNTRWLLGAAAGLGVVAAVVFAVAGSARRRR